MESCHGSRPKHDTYTQKVGDCMSGQSNENYFATIGGVYDDGVSLIFDGQETPTEKHYKVNTSVTFSAGDRVKILPYKGTYVVEYVVGERGGSSSPTDPPDSTVPEAANSVVNQYTIAGNIQFRSLSNYLYWKRTDETTWHTIPHM